jgi:UDP:flavonoid glycosyltransferase YjiC (YdhE family)
MHLHADLVIADHSPSALVACKILNLKTVLLGTGFFRPPAVSPLPGFVGMSEPSHQHLLNNDNQVLQSINTVLQENATPVLKNLCQLFDVAGEFLCTFAELDHYPDRQDAHYWGPRFDIDIGTEFSWPKVKGHKVFAYIKEDTPSFDKLLAALVASQKSVVLFIPRASQKTSKICAVAKNIHLLNTPANMRQVLEQTDMIVCHAGHGVVSLALLAGKNLLLVPSQLEQSMLAFMLTKRRLVAAVNPRQDTINYPAAIEFACSNRELQKNVADFKLKYATFDQQNQLDLMVKCCQDLVN